MTTTTVPTPDLLRQAVATAMGTDEFMAGQSRFRLRCRRILILLLRKTGRSLSEIGDLFGKDHTTILSAIRHASLDEIRQAARIWDGLRAAGRNGVHSSATSCEGEPEKTDGPLSSGA